MTHHVFRANISPDGRIKLPNKLMNQLDWETGMAVEIFAENNYLIIKSLRDKCVFCGEDTPDVFLDKPLCKKCRHKIITTSI
jgi:bifunctional DNA-binding transcriptional regulator/antitoxin component of YhaV-PrlF toxin-antitoxin module